MGGRAGIAQSDAVGRSRGTKRTRRRKIGDRAASGRVSRASATVGVCVFRFLSRVYLSPKTGPTNDARETLDEDTRRKFPATSSVQSGSGCGGTARIINRCKSRARRIRYDDWAVTLCTILCVGIPHVPCGETTRSS